MIGGSRGRSFPGPAATLDTGASLFFDHRDPAMVTWLNSRAEAWIGGRWGIPVLGRQANQASGTISSVRSSCGGVLPGSLRYTSRIGPPGCRPLRWTQSRTRCHAGPISVYGPV